jgi:hypothetical protein
MNNVYDSWADDGREVDPGELMPRLATLRDNEEPELPTKGQARQRRLDNMQRELNEIMQFVEDCDRYAEQTRDIILVGNDVRTMMGAHLGRLRAKAVERGRHVNGELRYIRAQTP